MQTSKKILVIDDEISIRRIIELKLKNSGYQVITASDGQQGLDLIYKEKPDAVITDINMPRMDGQTLCLQTNALKKDRPFFTLIITARISLDEQKWIGEMDDTQLMEKPFSPSRLVECIEGYFKN